MSSYKLTCDVVLILLNLQMVVRSVDSYILPNPTFEVLKPRGLRISIPDEAGLGFFGFHGNVNNGIRESEPGQISGEVYAARNGKWSIQDTGISLQDGNIINYWISAQADGKIFKKTAQTWTVTSSSASVEMRMSTSTEGPETFPSNLVFNENFDSLNKTIWLREVKMPLSPDYEFCVYHNDNHESMVQITDGLLRLKPLILEDYYGENATAFGRMQLSGCTSMKDVECTRQAVAYNILPPVLSVRFTTKQSFSFQYGKIEIRAKFPEGDWIYPEMWLEPKYNSYGRGYDSGRVLLGISRGNENLIKVGTRAIFDSRKLDFGVIVRTATNISEHLVSKMQENRPRWTRDFHVYTTIWTADGFKFLVDGQEVGSLSPGTSGWLEQNMAHIPKSAPFDQEFYLTVGVGVGGIRIFPDETTSSGFPKPWRNVGAKAMLKFWHARNEWLPSWKRENGRKTAFEIDYIRVWTF